MPFVRVATIDSRNPVVDTQGRPVSWFVTALNTAFGNLAAAVNQLAALPDIQAALSAAQQAADNANMAAAQAQGQVDSAKRESALVNSYIDPSSVVTATDTVVTIAAHTRHYADGTTASVDGGTATATASGDVDYVSYVDPDRTGGAVLYIVSTNPPVQTGDTHVVGAVTIPAAGEPPSDGGDGPTRPGQVYPRKILDTE